MHFISKYFAKKKRKSIDQRKTSNYYILEDNMYDKGNNNSEQSNKGKVKTHKYINRQNQSTTGKL
jgi:hypothetical protein